MTWTNSPLSSVQYAQQIDADRGYMADAGDDRSPAFFTFTLSASDGAGVGQINLIRLPPGRIRIYPELSFLSVDDASANSDFHLGHRAYTKLDGTTEAEDDNEWIDNGDTGGGAKQGTWTELGNTTSNAFNGSVGKHVAEYESMDGVTIFATIDTGDMDVSDVIYGFVVYERVSD